MSVVDNFKVAHDDFERTLGIFRSMTRKPLKMTVIQRRKEDRASLYVDDNYNVVVPFIVHGKTQYETYYVYVLFEHEIAHVLFRSDIDVMYEFAKSKEFQEIALKVFNIVEDERVDFLWRKLYTTPLRQVWKWFRGDIIPQTPIDILLDVRCDKKSSDGKHYVEIFDTLQEMIKGVHDNIYIDSTIRTSDKIYDYIISLLKEQDKKKQQDGSGQSQQSDSSSEEQSQGQSQSQNNKESEAEALERELDFMKRNNMPIGSEMPDISIGVKSKNLTEKQEKERTDKIIETLKSQMAHTNTRETPESKMSSLGGVDSHDFQRETVPLDIEKHSAILDIKAIETEWLDDEGEDLDAEEIIYKRLTDDFQAPTMIDEVEGLGMHVLFLLDYSGSMKEDAGINTKSKVITKVQVLASIVWSLWNELLLIPGCKVEAILYSGYPSDQYTTNSAAFGKKGLSGVRVESPTELLYHRPNGGTNSAMALEYAYNVMTSRSERGVIIHITDGDAFDKVETGKVLRKIQDEGVPVFNIFITRNKTVEYSRNAHFGSFVMVDLKNLADCIKSSIVPILQNYLQEIT